MAVIDSYAVGDSDFNVSVYVNAQEKVGQAFPLTTQCRITQAKFYLRKYGSPTGTCRVEVYKGSTTGILATMPLIAYSGTLDVTSLTTTQTQKTFNFAASQQKILEEDYWYAVVVAYNGGNADNRIAVYADQISPSHGGKLALISDYETASWATSSLYDAAFEISGNVVNMRKYGPNNTAVIGEAQGVAQTSIGKINGVSVV